MGADCCGSFHSVPSRPVRYYLTIAKESGKGDVTVQVTEGQRVTCNAQCTHGGTRACVYDVMPCPGTTIVIQVASLGWRARRCPAAPMQNPCQILGCGPLCPALRSVRILML
jgi:hypothetical protein